MKILTIITLLIFAVTAFIMVRYWEKQSEREKKLAEKESWYDDEIFS